VSSIIDIRDRALGYRTQINIFIAIVYIRNATRATDTWFMCVAHRDLTANRPTANSANTYPACIVIGQFTKMNGHYPRVDDPIAGNTAWKVPTSLLYYPEPVPALQPALPPTFDIDIEKFRLNIIRNRK
jgi:hypothetical protein